MSRPRKPFSIVERSRKEIAQGVEKHLTNGPNFNALGLSKEQSELASSAYQMWAESYVLEEIHYLLHRDLQP